MIQWEREHKRDFCLALTVRGFDVQWHEDKQEVSIPDVSFGFERVDGWLEFKFLGSRPKIFSLKKFTEGQQEWLIQRGSKGCGAAFLVLGTREGTTHVFHWSVIRDYYQKTDWEEAMSLASVTAGSTVKGASLFMNLMRHPEFWSNSVNCF